jgi:hypothetical protein
MSIQYAGWTPAARTAGGTPALHIRTPTLLTLRSPRLGGEFLQFDLGAELYDAIGGQIKEVSGAECIA